MSSQRALLAAVRGPRDLVPFAGATFFGLGLAPVAPGTFGTLGGVAVAWALRGTEDFLLWILLAALALYVLGRVVAPWAERAAGKDPGAYVIDEVVGYLVTVAWIGGPSTLSLFTAFVVFRFFDILKPPPASNLESLKGGLGILVDDLVTGFMALVVVQVVARGLFLWQFPPGA